MSKKANLISLLVSNATSVDVEYLYENDDYVNKLRDMLQHDVSVEQCVSELNAFVNTNF